MTPTHTAQSAIKTSFDKALVVGAKGEWGSKIVEQLKDNKKISVSCCDKNEHAQFSSKHYDVAIVATPPETHASACKELHAHQISCEQILIDKPNPSNVLAELEVFSKQNNQSISFVDHYLYKPEVQNIQQWFTANKNTLKAIEIFICESKVEFRDWMMTSEHGGVINDLAHHGLAIIELIMNQTDQPLEWQDIQLNSHTTFNRNFTAKENYVDISAMLNELEIRIVVGKQCAIDQKSISFIEKNNSLTTFSLTGTVDYQEVLKQQNTEKLLNFSQIKSINNTLDQFARLVSQKKTSQYKETLPGDILNPDAEKTVNQVYAEFLGDMFKHRHLYYWGTYFKLSLYFVFMLISPYFAYYYIKDEVVKAEGILVITTFIVSIMILTMIKELKDFLNSEDIRLVEVHKRYKELMRSAGISLEVKKQKGVGNHMMTVLTTFLKTLSIASLFISLFLWIFKT